MIIAQLMFHGRVGSGEASSEAIVGSDSAASSSRLRFFLKANDYCLKAIFCLNSNDACLGGGIAVNE